jgi:hypothetical protein
MWCEMKKRYMILGVLGAVAMLSSGAAQASTVVFNTPLSVGANTVDSIAGWDTHYTDMAGMAVTVGFSDGSSETVAWDSSGGAYGKGWSLDSNSPASSTYSGGYWNFAVLGSIGVNSILLDGFNNNVLFDVHPFDNSIYSSDLSPLNAPGPESQGTAGSLWGQALITDIWGATTTYGGQIGVTYLGEVALTGAPAVGDLYGSMLITFDSYAFGSKDTFKFYQDTDTITAPVPEPATMALFGMGLVGILGGRLRKKKK